MAQADLPCIFVQPLSKDITQLDNVYDEVTSEILIGVCVEEGKYQRKETDEGTATRFLTEIEGGRNSDESPIETSITYAMRNNFTLDGTVVYQENRTEWGGREYTGGSAKEIHMFFTIKWKVKNTS